jgi:hypothetical protein
LGAQVKVVSVEHLSSEELGAYLSNSLSDAEREAVERHLASCGECRAELVEGQRAVATAPGGRRGSRSRFYVLGLAAAAAVAFAIWPRTDFRPGPEVVERNAPAREAGNVTVVSPAAEAEVGASAPAFTWKSNDGASYKITVTDAAGVPLWSASTSDTTIVMPSTIQLSRGQQYFWYVDALRTDGRSVTSGVNGFRTAR